MQTIPLTKGYAARVDDDKFDELSKHTWMAQVTKEGNVYAARSCYVGGKYQIIAMHRQVAGTLGIKGTRVDHRDFDTLNNQRDNLRVCTQSQNCMHTRKRSGTSSRYKGVSWEAKRGMWRVHIHLNNKRVQVGRFLSEEDAAAAYDKAATLHFGEYALLNTHPLVQTNDTWGRIDPFDPRGDLGRRNCIHRPSVRQHKETVWLLEDMGLTTKQISAHLGINLFSVYNLSAKRGVSK